MKIYRYVEYGSEKVIAEIEAQSILIADAILKERTGLVAEKEHGIGCYIAEPIPANR